MKNLRIRLRSQAKADALRTAARFEATLTHADGVMSRTKAGQHTAENGQLFFYVTVEDDAVQTVGDEARNIGGTVEELEAVPQVDECLNCGNVADEPLAICPNCHFCEISPCPRCGTNIARVAYRTVEGDLFSCPKCDAHVRLTYVEPLWDDDGRYNQPVVVVTEARR